MRSTSRDGFGTSGAMMEAMTDLGIPGVGDATLIASGGSALVYKALSGTGEELAVKVLRGMRGAEVARRFEREQTAAERLRGHPAIIRIHHSGITAAGEPYLVMPLIGEGSLNDELEEAGAFPLPKATGDVAQAADALQFAHENGVLHRDIKPGNLLRADDGSIIVTDFGIARVTDAGITSATVGAATPLYAAPELLAENDASVQSEVYALGATLYALLNGKAAFADSANIWASMHRIRTEAPPAIAGVPDPVMRVIGHAMHKDATARPESASAFVELLRTALTAPADWAPTVEIDPPAQPDSPPAPETVVLGDALVGEPILGTPDKARTVPAPVAATTSQQGAPPAPAYDRPVPVTHVERERSGFIDKAAATVLALLLIGGFAWFAFTRILPSGTVTEGTVAPPVDNSLPSPNEDRGGLSDDVAGTTAEADLDSNAGSDSDVSVDDLSTEGIPNTFVSFTGDHFSALLPEGWAVLSRDVDEGYGFRSSFIADDMYLNIDTTPEEQRDTTLAISQSARDIASGISSASSVRTEEVDGLVMHSFTFRNRQGVDSIDIFFEVDGDGYAVVAGSRDDPDTAFSTARLVALSIRSNPDQ